VEDSSVSIDLHGSGAAGNGGRGPEAQSGTTAAREERVGGYVSEMGGHGLHSKN